MKSNSFFYLIVQGARNLWMHSLMTMASIAVLTTCLLLVGFAILFTINVNNMVSHVEKQNEVVVFIKDGTSQIEMEEIGNFLKQHQLIDKIDFISKEKALKIEKDRLGDEAILLEGLDKDNPLPASFSIVVSDLEEIESVVVDIEQFKYVEKINVSTQVTDTLILIRQIVQSSGGAVVIALLIVSLVIIANTIRSSVFTRRREISIMKYVGATNSFIRLPFIIEGIFMGLLSAGIAFFITWGGYTAFISIVSTSTNTWIEGIATSLLYFKDIMFYILYSYIFSGVIIGTLGSGMSIKSHLKV